MRYYLTAHFYNGKLYSLWLRRIAVNYPLIDANGQLKVVKISEKTALKLIEISPGTFKSIYGDDEFSSWPHEVLELYIG